MQRRLLMWLVVALIANGASLRTAHAQFVTTLDPGAFAPGTNVTDAFAGVTLSTFSLNVVGSLPPNGLPLYAPSYAPVYAAKPGDPTTNFPSSVFSSTPSLGFGYGAMWGGVDGSCFSVCTPPNRPDGFGTNLLVQFASPVTSVGILDIGNWANGVYMEAFNASNQIVGFCDPAVGVLAVGNYGCFSVLDNTLAEGGYEEETSILASNSSGIAKILIGGYNESFDMSKIQYTTRAPEIDPTSSASGLSLLLGALLILRGRRPMNLNSSAD
jgi:hypothetical protein